MSRIHPTAIVDGAAQIAGDVEIGPYTIIGPHVQIGSGCRIGPHTVVTGHTRIGINNRIFQFVSLGEIPQDKKYSGEPTRLEIGDNNVIREFCTFNIGTAQDVGVTRLGNNNWIMAYAHLAHDCQVGNHTIFANNTQLAGHVVVGDYAILGGLTGVHQFCRIGAHAITGGSSLVLKDVPPFVMASGNPAKPYGINSEGLKRRGFSTDAIVGIKRAYRAVYRTGDTVEQALATLKEQAAACPEVQPLVDFLAVPGRGIIR
jgi:UDP-N-acetylglucosamine acyltransferase